ncbi:hypothetical protein ACIQGZ_14790 [Streptomyces sp. NPDC092296]|uniref:hypothetical protein n=1 Tax=Streptomyces sp. NPDC092296 TaxID=3366012 RepID=UPI0037FB47B4
MTADQAAEAAEAAEPDVRWEVPLWFHSLGLDLPPEQRTAHLDEIAAEVWAGGTDFQRSTVAAWYAEIAAAAEEDGVLYAGLNLFRTDDDRVATASLVVLATDADTSDPEAAAAALVELLSADPANEVLRTDVSCGPAVLSLSGLVVDLSGEDSAAVPLELAQAEAHIPVPGADTLLVLRLSTPSLREFPEYVRLLAQTADTVAYDRPDAGAAAIPEQLAARVTGAFG